MKHFPLSRKQAAPLPKYSFDPIPFSFLVLWILYRFAAKWSATTLHHHLFGLTFQTIWELLVSTLHLCESSRIWPSCKDFQFLSLFGRSLICYRFLRRILKLKLSKASLVNQHHDLDDCLGTFDMTYSVWNSFWSHQCCSNWIWYLTC